MGLSRKQLALIHIAKKELNLTDDYYRMMLQRVGGVDSSKDLNYPGFRKLMRLFRDLGWKGTGQRDEYRSVKGERMVSPGQIKKIWKLWFLWVGDGNPTAKQQLRKFLFARFKVSDVRWLTYKKAYQVIEAIKAMLARRDADARTKQV